MRKFEFDEGEVKILVEAVAQLALSLNHEIQDDHRDIALQHRYKTAQGIWNMLMEPEDVTD